MKATPKTKNTALTSEINLERKVFCNRTLNLRSIRAIGYDMDYTLIHYRVEEWERRAYEHVKEELLRQGWPVQDLQFDPTIVCRGLVIDTERGNLLKANRFGFVKHAMHGVRALNFNAQREAYSRTIIDLMDRRWVFLNTLFSLSEGCIYAQLVELLDQRLIPEVLGYLDLYNRVRNVLQRAHMEGRLKAEIIADPERFVILEPEVPLALLDQHHAKKKLMLITNSEWSYTAPMMSYTFDRFLPKGMVWQDLFDLVIVAAGKPEFFTGHQALFEIATEDGLLRPSYGKFQKDKVYFAGSAQQVEAHFGFSGDEILYVGDHMFGDVHVSKNVLRWRTALILRELEQELASSKEFRSSEAKLAHLMEEKESLEAQLCQAKLKLQRKANDYGPPLASSGELSDTLISELREQISELDLKTAPLAKRAAELNNPFWGLMMRAGNDKSYLAYQVERYADIYTSRVSNFLHVTPFSYLRSPRGSLPHDPVITPLTE
ncbi:MAG: HAD-IG family 5'-nucleotidase [Bdellovibrionia bacterium]